MKRAILCMTGVGLILASSWAGASTIRVPDDQPTIQAAIGAAAYGDTVRVAPGVYYENVIMANGVWLMSDGGEGVTIVDAGYLGTVIRGTGLDSNTAVVGFTIRHGVAPWTDPQGGGLRFTNSSLRVEDNLITDNTAYFGGGAYVAGDGRPQFSRNSFESNHATDHAGGLCLEDCGALVLYNRFQGNTANGCAGAISLRSCVDVVVDGDTLRNNTAQRCGAGLYSEYSDNVKVCRCEIVGNISRTTDGGGVQLYGTSALLEWNLIANNQCAGGGGGVLWVAGSEVEFRNNTLVGNTAAHGGGLYAGGAVSAIVERNIIVGSTGGYGVYLPAGGTATLSCNDVWNNLAGNYFSTAPGPGDFSEDPRFCGTPGSEYTLENCSPCVEGYGCGLVGAFPVGCGGTLTERASWSSIKAMYR
jgi:hypothetical protein